jgi:hypothetical protein
MGWNPQLEKYCFSEVVRSERGVGSKLSQVQEPGIARKSQEALPLEWGIESKLDTQPSEMLDQLDLHCS